MGRIAGFERYRASLIEVSGEDEGEEHRVDRPRWLVGRGPDVDAAFDDAEMSRQHAAIEFARGRFRLRDLGSRSGIQVNGTTVADCELRPGDRIRIGGRVFQVLIERTDALPVYAPTGAWRG